LQSKEHRTCYCQPSGPLSPLSALAPSMFLDSSNKEFIQQRFVHLTEIHPTEIHSFLLTRYQQAIKDDGQKRIRANIQHTSVIHQASYGGGNYGVQMLFTMRREKRAGDICLHRHHIVESQECYCYTGQISSPLISGGGRHCRDIFLNSLDATGIMLVQTLIRAPEPRSRSRANRPNRISSRFNLLL